MTNDTPNDPGPQPPTRKQAREVRLALELRANLARRKVLTRARSAGAVTKAPEPDCLIAPDVPSAPENSDE